MLGQKIDPEIQNYLFFILYEPCQFLVIWYAIGEYVVRKSEIQVFLPFSGLSKYTILL
jgi:hypothetical protein